MSKSEEICRVCESNGKMLQFKHD